MDERGARLLAIARDAIDGGGAYAAGGVEDWLNSRGATFVTLKLGGELRGCIGSVDPRRPLWQDVAHNARAAAYSDPRFPPVSVEERGALDIEVSVLSAREPLEAPTEGEALLRIRPRVDGIYLAYGSAAATFLPQVWESIPDPLEFLAALRRKAGLPARFWHPELRLWRYTVEKFA